VYIAGRCMVRWGCRENVRRVAEPPEILREAVRTRRSYGMIRRIRIGNDQYCLPVDHRTQRDDIWELAIEKNRKRA
jgi:hypothetical protein